MRNGGGALVHNLIDVEISCLPADLPEFIQVDVADLEVGHSLHLSDLPLPADVTLVALTHGEDRDISVVSVQPPRGGQGQDEDEEVAEGEEPAE